MSGASSAVPADGGEEMPLTETPSDAATRLEGLAERGSGVLRNLLIASRAILIAGSSGAGSREFSALVDDDLLQLKPAEQHRKLCERYLSLSKELKDIVAECETCAAAAEAAAAEQDGRGGEQSAAGGPAQSEAELEARAEELRQRVRANNATVLESMKCIQNLLGDLQMWEDTARSADKAQDAAR